LRNGPGGKRPGGRRETKTETRLYATATEPSELYKSPGAKRLKEVPPKKGIEKKLGKKSGEKGTKMQRSQG